MDYTPLIISGLTGAAALAGSWFVARRYQKMGGGEAQSRLNTVLADTIETLEANVAAQSAKLATSREEFVGCKQTLMELGDEVSRMRRERIYLRQDIDDLHEEVRQFRRTGAQDARDTLERDAQTARDTVKRDAKDVKDSNS